MKLKEYIQKFCINRKKFADAIGVSTQTVDRIQRGNDTSVSIANKIFDLTEGKVTCRDLQPTVPFSKSLCNKKKKVDHT